MPRNIIFNLNIWKVIRGRSSRIHKKLPDWLTCTGPTACKKVFNLIWSMFKTFIVIISSFLWFCLATTIAWWFLDSSRLTTKKEIFSCNSFLKVLSLLFMALPLWFLWQWVERRSIIKRQEERPTMHWRQIKGTSCCKIRNETNKILINKQRHTNVNTQRKF